MSENPVKEKCLHVAIVASVKQKENHFGFPEEMDFLSIFVHVALCYKESFQQQLHVRWKHINFGLSFVHSCLDSKPSSASENFP